jgi:quercetin dioxygenase-like cupin family protein
LHKEEAWLQGTGPSSKTLVKHPDLRIVLLAMRKKMCMHEHKTAARISMQTLAGHIRLRLPDRMVELPTGQMLVLDQCVPHDVEAEEDSAFLLTLSWHGQGSDTRARPANRSNCFEHRAKAGPELEVVSGSTFSMDRPESIVGVFVRRHANARQC